MKQFIEYGLVVLASLLFFSFYQFQSAYLPGTDGYYHIKMAYVMREMGFISNFKWAHLSLWRDHFSDKEFLYHVYLIPFTYFKDLMFGAKVGTVILASLGSTSFYAILRLNKVKYSWFWFLLLFMSGSYFLYRTNVTRPQVLSIVLALWSIHFVINRKLIHLAILTFIYTFSYTAYHLPLIFACTCYGYQLLFEKKNDWKLPVITLGATLAGMLCSPFFPNNFEFFYLQNFYIPYMAKASSVNLHMGGEFGAMSTKSAVIAQATLVITFVAAFFMAMYKPKKWDSATRSLFFITLSLIWITAFSKRFTEYSVPVTLLFCAIFFKPYFEDFELKWKPLTLKKIGIGIVVIGSMLGLGYNSYFNTVDEFRGAREPGLKSAAEYLLEHTEEDELVFTADWDDAPELFFYNHKNRYLIFLDPNFMYYWDKEIWQKWSNVANGMYSDKTYDVLKNEFKIRYGVATNNFRALKTRVIMDPRMEIVHKSSSAYVFKLNEEEEIPEELEELEGPSS